MKPTVLVTGARGFLGGALCSRLGNLGINIVPAVRSEAIDDCKQIAVGNINSQTDWLTALKGVNVVVHCAARVHMVVETAEDPLLAFRTVNTEGTLNLAEQAAATGVRRFVFVSSIKVNGEVTSPGRPFTADDVANPRDAYGISKHEAEIGLGQLAKKTGMEIVIIRPPLVYGLGVRANFAAMMRWLSRGIPLPFASICNNRRSFIALDNMADLLVTCVDHPAAANQTFLVSDGEDLSTSDLLRRLGDAMNKPACLLPMPSSLLHWGGTMLGKAEMAQRLLESLQVDIAKTRELLGWSPIISVDEGLRRAAQGFVK